MTYKTLKILLVVIAVNLTIQTVKDVGLFPTAYAQNNLFNPQQVEICGRGFVQIAGNSRLDCAEVLNGELKVTND